MPPRIGVLLVGHGTREPVGVAQFLELAERFSASWPEVTVAPCFLELAEPPIAAGIDRLLAAGIDELIVAPLLLFSAGHAQEDIPTAVEAAIVAAGRSDLPRWQTEPLEDHPELLALSQIRFEQARGDRPVDQATRLVMIGRGSRDAGATAAMQRYAKLHAQQVGVGPPIVGFLAVQQPNLQQALALAAADTPARVIVQPHLLFEGLLSAEIREAVAEAGQHWPHISWSCAAPLGPEPQVLRALRSACERR